MAEDPRPTSSFTEERLIEIERGGMLRPGEAAELAASLRHMRAKQRRESRYADQVRRMRWALENIITKIEVLKDRVIALEPMPGDDEDLDAVPGPSRG